MDSLRDALEKAAEAGPPAPLRAAEHVLPFVTSRPRHEGRPPKLTIHTLPEITSPDHELTVLIPAYNEASRLPQTLRWLRNYLDHWGIDYRVVVIDDGSTDDTATQSDAFGRRFSTLRLGKNLGKGAAVRAGMLRATGRIIAFTDADLPYDLLALRQGVMQIQYGGEEIVVGARDHDASRQFAERRPERTLATWLFRGLVRTLISRTIVDTQCGLKIFRHSAARQIFSRSRVDSFAFDAEAIFLAQKLGFRCVRIPVTLVNEMASSLSLRRHALPMIVDLIRIRLEHALGRYGRLKRIGNSTWSSQRLEVPLQLHLLPLRSEWDDLGLSGPQLSPERRKQANDNPSTPWRKVA